MKILLQHLGNGRTTLEEVPAPGIQAGHVLIRTTCSVVSSGTERMLVEFGKGNLLQKAQQQPERVRQVLNKMRTDGVLPTIQTVRRKLNQPIPLGYCNAGLVIGVGEGVTGVAVGDRVASNGPHAEIVSVPKNLVAKIPDDVRDEAAAFAPLAAIALHGFRLSEARVGETVVVIGLGLVGTLAAQWASIAGCRIIGFDVSAEAVARPTSFDMRAFNSSTADAEAVVCSLTGGRGADVVLVCTSTASADPLNTAVAVCRAGGSVVLIGTAGIELPRRPLFDKEIRFQVSRSYGPGRYDSAYETGGADYPAQYARWTAGRNFEAALGAMSASSGRSQRLDITSFPTTEVAFEDAPSWYIAPPDRRALATIFRYQKDSSADRTVHNNSLATKGVGSGISILGAGPFVQSTLLPALQELAAPLYSIGSKTGASAGILAKRFSIPISTSDYRTVLEDQSVGLVVIATPHETHASLVCEALTAGKAVFVEKPLALTAAELSEIEETLKSKRSFLHVGHNRRFAPLAVKAKAALQSGVPRHIVATVNAGVAPAPKGGRFLGEAGHWIDLCAFFAGSSIASVSAVAAGIGDVSGAQILFGDGSTASIQYLTEGSARYEKERIEIHSAGTTVIIRAWRRLEIWRPGGKAVTRATQDKGHKAQLSAVLKAWKDGGAPPVPLEETINVSRALLAAIRSAQERRWVDV